MAAVTGGALSLIASTMPPASPGDDTARLRLAAGPEDNDVDGARDREEADDGRRPSLVPVDLGGRHRARDSDDDSDDADDSADSDDDAHDSDGDAHDSADEDLDALRRADDAATRRRAEDDERRRREEADRQARDDALRGDCDGLRDGGLGAVKQHVREAGAFLGCRFGKPVEYGVAGRGGPSDHPVGLAIDFMVNRATGDTLAQCALDNMEALGVKYVIWEQRINFGSGWRPMEDRGSVTANHFDHVHVSFNPGRGTGDVRSC